MPKSKKPTTPETIAFFSSLQNLLGLLPTEDQRRETTAIFNKLIHFFTDLRDKFSALPTREDAADIQQSLARLEELLRQAETSSKFAESIGVAPKPKKTSTRTTAKKPSEVEVSALAETIKRLPAEEIRARLSDKLHLAATIKQVALSLGIMPGSKKSKAMLIDEIINYIETARMGDRLAGRTESEWSLADSDEVQPEQTTASF